MSATNSKMMARYRNRFLAEVEANVEEGEWVKMCMQCGVCAGSCPFGPHWEHPPQEIFMMIRAGKRDAVLTSTSMWMCTSCYNCLVRCPRELPITHIMHGLAHYAKRLGISAPNQPTEKFAQLFWDNLAKNGRVNELILGLGLYFMNGFGEGVKTSLKMADVGFNMVKTGRLNPLEILGGHTVSDKTGLHAILAKAKQIEDSKIKQSAAV